MSVAPALAPPAALPPPLSSGAPPGAPPPAQPFHSALSEEWARTAPAEGQQNESRKADDPDRPHHEGDGHRRLDGDEAGASTEATAGAAGLASSTPETRPDATPASAGPSTHTSAGPGTHEGIRGEHLDATASATADSLKGAAREVSVAAHRSTRAGEESATAKGVAEETAPAKDARPAVESPDGAGVVDDLHATISPKDSEGHERIERHAQPLQTAAKESRRSDPDRVGTSSTARTPASAPPRTDGAKAPAAADGASAETEPAPQAQTLPAETELWTGARTSATVPADRPSAGLEPPVRSAVVPSVAETRSRTAPRAILGNSPKAHASAQTTSLAAPRTASTSVGGQPLQAAVVEAGASQSSATAEGGPLLDSGVDLQGMIDSINATIEIAARKGIGQARIALQPAELGQIRIHLSQTSDGLLARVTADTPAAAQALAASRGELQQSLSSLGTSLLGLDIGSFKQPGERDAQAPGAAKRSGATGDDASIEAIDEPDGPSPAPRLPLGGLVDVLA